MIDRRDFHLEAKFCVNFESIHFLENVITSVLERSEKSSVYGKQKFGGCHCNCQLELFVDCKWKATASFFDAKPMFFENIEIQSNSSNIIIYSLFTGNFRSSHFE